VTHMDDKSGLPQWTCASCGAVFVRRDHLVAHCATAFHVVGVTSSGRTSRKASDVCDDGLCGDGAPPIPPPLGDAATEQEVLCAGGHREGSADVLPGLDASEDELVLPQRGPLDLNVDDLSAAAALPAEDLEGREGGWESLQVGSDPSQSVHLLQETMPCDQNLSLTADLERWMTDFFVPRSHMISLLELLRRHGVIVPVAARTMERHVSVGRFVREMDAAEWNRLWEIPGAGGRSAESWRIQPTGVVYSIWSWVEFILSSRYLRESLVVDADDPRCSLFTWWPESFRVPAFRETIRRAREAGVTHPLQVVLYVDAFQPYDYGSSRSVTGVYFTLANFPRSLSSQTRNIFLLALVEERKSNVFAVLSALCSHWLNTRREMEVGGVRISVILQLWAVIADMKERNLLCSVTPASSNHFCHRCTAHKSDILMAGEEHPSHPRRKEDSLRFATQHSLAEEERGSSAAVVRYRRIEEGRPTSRNMWRSRT